MKLALDIVGTRCNRHSPAVAIPSLHHSLFTIRDGHLPIDSIEKLVLSYARTIVLACCTTRSRQSPLHSGSALDSRYTAVHAGSPTLKQNLPTETCIRRIASLKPNRRKRGGQKGNQNARKHGFYSPTLSPAETDQLWTIINVEGLDPRVALLRVKLLSSLQHNPGNRRVLAEASRLLAKAYSDICSLDAADHKYLKTVIELILESIVAQRSPAPPAQECERPVLTKRIPCTLTIE